MNGPTSIFLHKLKRIVINGNMAGYLRNQYLELIDLNIKNSNFITYNSHWEDRRHNS